MTLIKKNLGFDPFIWTPEIYYQILEATPGHKKYPVLDLGGSEDEYKRIAAILLPNHIERDPKPIDWLISIRDEMLVKLAHHWIKFHVDRTPKKFVDKIWNPLCEAFFDPDFDNDTDAAFLKFGIPVVPSDANPDADFLADGLLWCLYSMDSLEAGEIPEIVKDLMEVSHYLGSLEGADVQRLTSDQAASERVWATLTALEDADQQRTPVNEEATAREPSPYSAFGRRGARKRHEVNDANKPKAQAHYTEHGHEYDNREDATFKMGEIYKVSHRTVGRWIVGLKPKHPKPDKVPR